MEVFYLSKRTASDSFMLPCLRLSILLNSSSSSWSYPFSRSPIISAISYNFINEVNNIQHLLFYKGWEPFNYKSGNHFRTFQITRIIPMNSTSKTIFKIAITVYVVILLSLTLHSFSSETQPKMIQQLNNMTAPILSSLIKTKYFRIIRLNLNSKCPIPLMNKLCRSQSCAVCRCDDKDIPQNWKKTDKVKIREKKIDVWEDERFKNSKQWVWHVEDIENDKGQYFDVNTNVESFSGYNGSYIWTLIYEENCFRGKSYFNEMCLQQKILYQIISGLHTSISSHLSFLYKNVTNIPEWADTGDSIFFYNSSQYQRRVLQHPDRIENLLFYYEILIRSIQKILPYLQNNHTISSDNIAEDLTATKLMDEFLKAIKKYSFRPFNETDASFFQANNSHVKQYQRYIHNISQILNCVECEKCKLFGKMQTYGLGTALKILLGYNTQYKRNQLVALFNSLNKVSVSVNNYFNFGTQKKKDRYIFVKIWGYCAGCFLMFLGLALNWDAHRKVKKIFKNVFPKQKKLRIQ